MDKSIKKAKLFILFFLILNILIVYFLIYLPINTELKKSKQEIFITLADSKVLSVNNYIESCKTGAESMSSRTMIRKKISAYYRDEISFEDLQNYTRDLYADGVKALNNSLGAVRLVEEKIVTSYGDIDLDLINEDKYSNDIEVEMVLKDTGNIAVVYSPIFEDSNILGYDAVYYNIDRIIDSISIKNVNVSLSSQNTMGYDKEIILKSGETLLEKDGIMFHFHKIMNTSKYLLFQIKTKDLYSDLKNIIIYNVLGLFIGLIILAYISNKFIISNAKRLLDRAVDERNEYENHANRDALTGAYSRMFLGHWAERNMHQFDGYIAMIDLDCFKNINDKFGHLTGDKVLIKFVEIIKSSIRNEDYVVRYGGDEFLIIIDSEDKSVVESIIYRIKDKAKSVEEFPFEILMSYGITKITEEDDIEKTIYKADEALYKNKEDRDCKTRRKTRRDDPSVQGHK